MATYNVSITSRKANATVPGTQVTADTQQAAQKAANGQAAVLSAADTQAACDWRATITLVD